MSEVEDATPVRNITQTVEPKEATPMPMPTPSAPSAPPAQSSDSNSRTITLPPPGEPLGQQLALELLCRGVRMAQSRGTYSLEEASLFLRAINEFTVRSS